MSFSRYLSWSYPDNIHNSNSVSNGISGALDRRTLVILYLAWYNYPRTLWKTFFCIFDNSHYVSHNQILHIAYHVPHYNLCWNLDDWKDISFFPLQAILNQHLRGTAWFCDAHFFLSFSIAASFLSLSIDHLFLALVFFASTPSLVTSFYFYSFFLSPFSSILNTGRLHRPRFLHFSSTSSSRSSFR